ncbi:MAG: putative TonB-dependent receptor, partial [Phenylobacterium sp.]|nr:putative TonB-dependent receptor [Phenylobacterium sp.]
GMIDHIEVLTGGASSVYGGDAVSGVVNLISKKNFEGVELNAQGTQTNHNDGRIVDVNLLVGVNSPDGKGNVTVYADYMDRQAVFQGARAYSNFALNSPNFTGCAGPTTLFGGFCAGGSPSIAEGRIAAGAGAGRIFNGARQLVPDDGRTYNFNPINYLQTPNTRYALGAYAHYEIKPWADFYTRVTFSENDSRSQLAETPVVAVFRTNFGNPNISAQERAILFNPAAAPAGGYGPSDTVSFTLRRRLVENGPRATHDTHDAYQVVVGLKGDINPDWSYDISGQFGHTQWDRILAGDVNQVKFGNGLLVNPDGTCFVGGACVPVDIFSTGSISPAAVKYFTVGAVGVGVTTQQDVQAQLVGDLAGMGLKSPWATNGVGIAIGAEYRREASEWRPDDNLGHIGQLSGFGATPAVSGSYNTKEVFGEIRVPLAQDLPYMKSLQLEGGLRYADYNRSGGTYSYKVALDYAPVADIRLRGSFDRAVRDPTINELFAADTPSADSGIDPCAAEGVGGVPYATTAALCRATGVPAASFHSTELDCGGQCNSHWLSNPNLKPEEADTKSIGVVFTPTFLAGFTASIDYYSIKIKKAIFRVPQPQVFQLCYDPAANPTQSAAAAACQLIHRDQFGSVTTDEGFVNLAYDNIGQLTAKGFDIIAAYKTPLSTFGMSEGWGSIGLDLVGNLVKNASYKISATTPTTNCLGLYGDICTSPQPKWRHNARVTWTSSDSAVSLSARWRYIGATSFDEVVLNGLNDPLDAHIRAYSYYDLTGTWRMNQTLDFSAGVKNVLNKNPPLIDINIAPAGIDSGNTFPGLYDTLGRVFFLGATARF